MKSENLFTQKSSLLVKMWINQFAFSLFGLFVASPFSGTLCIFAGVFSYLFYMSVVGYAVLDDAQKDRISYLAGRNSSVGKATGIKYSLLAYAPTVAVTAIYAILTFTPAVKSTAMFIVKLVIKFIMCGEILGIDAGLTNYTYDSVTMQMVSNAPSAVVFMGEHGFFHLIFAAATPIILGIIYYLGFSGIVSINTTAKKKAE